MDEASVTTYARLVLRDAMYVRSKLEDETDDREWWLAWVLVVVLLRTVGDVLHKVDGAHDPQLKAVSKELYHSWDVGQENAIFRDFIKLERDALVHQYFSNMTEGSVAVAVISAEAESGDSHWLSENLYRPMSGGIYEGEDGRDVLDSAIAWWERQLAEIERRMS